MISMIDLNYISKFMDNDNDEQNSDWYCDCKTTVYLG